jgi:lipid A 3-O-deacylase
MRPVRFVLILVCAFAGWTRAQAQAEATSVRSDRPADFDPTTRWELDYETGILWRFTGSATPLDYVIMPQILSVKTPAIFQVRWAGGDLVMRQRFSFLAEPIVKGPEHHYFGLTGSGILEWWDHARTRSLFFSSGGGVGELDAHGYEIAGAQGQEFNLTWFIYGGARLRFTDRLSASVGLYFQHLSNGHLNKVDPGLNALGPMLSAGWHF